MNRRRGFLERHYRTRHQRAQQSRQGINPAAMMRFAGLVVAVLVGIAVFIGFDEDRLQSGWVQQLANLEGITRPVFLGGSLLEWALISALLAYVLWVGLRSKRSRHMDEDDQSEDDRA